MSKSKYKESIEDINIIRVDLDHNFGFAARYTKYDLDSNISDDEDIRGGLYFSYPFFDFGRSSAKISGAKAKSYAAKNSGIDIERKNDLNSEAEYLNVESSVKSRNELYQAFTDTRKHRNNYQEIEGGRFATQLYDHTSRKISQF